MDKENIFNTDRRQFISKVIPACAITCFGLFNGIAFGQQSDKKTDQNEKHKFDGDFERKLTHRRITAMRYGEFIALAKDMKTEFGEERTIEFLKKRTTREMLDYGKFQAEKYGDNSFQKYIEQFRSGYENSLTMKIVEDSEKAFELEVTECLWASTFLKAEAGDIGYAAVCWGDYSWVEGFNPKIKMIRDKTLMQGHPICNHRYILNT